MNTPCKMLAMAWMALRPFSTNVHADTINWEEVSHFFNFNTIAEEEKRTHLETNIRLLVEEQLKLPSGQNLWKAFQFWEEQHPELGFQFEFSLMRSASAHIELKKYEDWSQTFRFEITCNEIFAENHHIPHWHKISRDLESNLALKRFLNINMLYRPCLIKLVNPDDPKNWNYHLREQKLPFFITLAHEFLHILNQLECVDWLMERNEEFSNPKSRIQEFLMEKLELKPDDNSLQEKYKIFWKNPNFDDSLDEMTVILKSKRQIALNERVFIGETTFLREYYKDKSIISWSHCSARDLEFWQKMPIILEKNYVNKVLSWFGFRLNMLVLSIIKEKEIYMNKQTFTYNNSFNIGDSLKNAEMAINCLIANKKTGIVYIHGKRNDKIEKIEIFKILKTDNSNVFLLPKCLKFISLDKYESKNLFIRHPAKV